ncbi:lipopolysaccharide kinase InaA family protein [Alloalcanivorax xenomutans]|uniref:lipopolysaccharide kinase InaA family protein n=1 Tax=Alloalcanivorax xenomutans TaxID=1094342 RepID=UPI0003B85F93|nr:lipopolysaccharide kinase InaA family protein [Alloalcanivorax xenomutans]ERS10167.1 hypothetical protein Q668_20750 [Alcanivorax sp. PN-3]WOD29052.1 lipopolysaccharide kinase InaA family protein [Alloalcanivorax xenomutans]
MRVPRKYIDPDWRPALIGWRLDYAAAWLALPDKALVDEPNLRYGGSMHVYRLQMDDGTGLRHNLYIKCQCNQRRRSLRHPVRGRATLETEFRALSACLKKGVPVARPVFFDHFVDDNGDEHYVLVSLGLDGFQSLDQIDMPALPLERRWRLLEDVGMTLRFMHLRGFAHRNLYPKHVFVAWRPALERFDVRFIDLEKTHLFTGFRHLFRDLESLARRSKNVSRRDQLRFLKYYLDTGHLSEDGKILARWLARKLHYR